MRNKTLFLHRITLLVLILWAGIGYAYAAKSDYATWNLDVVFYNASNDITEAEISDKISQWVSTAERIYQRRPSLVISYRIERITQKGGRHLNEMIFSSNGEYAKYMDDNFDNVAVTKTEGHLTVLVTDRLCIGTFSSGDRKGQPKCWGGIAHFPHDVNPFSKKRGITLASYKDGYTFAHELGHVFGLKHTFEPYVGLNLQCNKSYKPKGRPEGECNSCEPGSIVYDADGLPDACDGRSNIMDYCGSSIDDEFLNSCQEQRAANQRQQYMTSDGKTNYWDLKGLAGEPICKDDGDCEDGRYCDTGTLTVGRNQCKPLKPLGDSCTRGAQCVSGRCNTGKCKEADECQTDRDCGGNAICRKGTMGVGQNTCHLIQSPTCPTGWNYETRNPLNKDRCNRTVTTTAELKCKLLITDKKKNWTGPHAQSGADECRSTKGKKPKGVKCPAGYAHKIRPGADTCEKTKTEHSTPTCPSGWDYKSKTGRDECEEK